MAIHSLPRIAYVVDDDAAARSALGFLLEEMSLDHRCFSSAEDFLSQAHRLQPGCVLINMDRPASDAPALRARLSDRILSFPFIVMSTDGSPFAISAAAQSGFVQFLEKPFDRADLKLALKAGFSRLDSGTDERAYRAEASKVIAGLTPTQVLVVRGLIAGMNNAEIGMILAVPPFEVQQIRARLNQHLGLLRPNDIVATGVAAGLMPLGHLHGVAC